MERLTADRCLPFSRFVLPLPLTVFLLLLVLLPLVGCSNTPAFVGKVKDPSQISTLAFRSQPPAEIYNVTANGVALEGLRSMFDILPGVHTISGDFETREHSCPKTSIDRCQGIYYYGDCFGTFTAEAGRSYTATVSALKKGAELSVIETSAGTVVGGGTCTTKGHSFSGVVR